MKTILLIISMSVIAFFPAAAQTQSGSMRKISVAVEDMTISQFASDIESRLPVHFYFNEKLFDSLRISLDVHDLPLDKILAIAFSNSGFYYVLDDHGHVFVSNVPMTAPGVVSEPGARKRVERPSAFVDSGFAKRDKVRKAEIDNKLYVIGDNGSTNGQPNATIVGYVRSAKTGEPIVGASVFIENFKTGVSTDQYGYFIISMPKGSHVLNIQSIGMLDVRRQIRLRSDGKMNIELQTEEITLKNVIVSAAKISNVKSMQLGVQRLDIKTIKQVPVVFGEADLLKVLQTLPGVKTVGEASSGLNVRGGSADQNLILFNDATIFNPSHFFGLFSTFNPEVIKDAELFKSSIPAKYGGRLSSVLNINSREGNKKEFTGSAGIGLLTSRLDIEGPLVKDKTSFILGGRTTYANWLLNLLPDQYKHSRASFYDVNLNVTHQINKNNNLYLTAYMSRDYFNLNSDTTYNYSNRNVSLKWKHVFSSKLVAQFTGGYDGYQYEIASKQNPVDAYKLHFEVNQEYFKTNFNYYLNEHHSFEFGLSTIDYSLKPGMYSPQGKQSIALPDTVQTEHALESAIYLSDRYTISSRFAVEGGIRYSVYNYLGPQTINRYAPDLPKTEDDITGQQTFGNNKVIKTYAAPEYRIAVKYMISDSFSVKAGYNTQHQYIHVLSNTTAIAPTDIYKLSDPNIQPQSGDQISLGLFKNFASNTIETSVEVYYKHINHYLDYKSGAVLVLNHHIETDVLNTKGKAYGIEFQIKKLTGKLNGWISYTYSRTLLKQDDPNAGELINEGKYYPANYDKPHDVTVISNYRVNHRFSVSLNGTYSTGRPITLPSGLFYYGGSYRTLYSDRNAYRIPDYFRMDFGLNIDGNHKVHQWTHNSWTLGVYNLTGRKNPYSVYYVSENGNVTGYKLSIFGSAIPYVNFNIRF